MLTGVPRFFQTRHITVSLLDSEGETSKTDNVQPEHKKVIAKVLSSMAEGVEEDDITFRGSYVLDKPKGRQFLRFDLTGLLLECKSEEKPCFMWIAMGSECSPPDLVLYCVPYTLF